MPLLGFLRWYDTAGKRAWAPFRDFFVSDPANYYKYFASSFLLSSISSRSLSSISAVETAVAMTTFLFQTLIYRNFDQQVERSSDYRCVLVRTISHNCTFTSLETLLARPATLCCVLHLWYYLAKRFNDTLRSVLLFQAWPQNLFQKIAPWVIMISFKI